MTSLPVNASLHPAWKSALVMACTCSALMASAAVQAHGANHHDKAARPAAAAAEQKDWGMAGQVSQAKRVVDIHMTDEMRFTPDHLVVQEGETVRLRIHNKGQLMHELVLGTMAELRKHAELMKKFPDMEHDEPHMAHVPPGQVGELVWTFNRPGNFEFACLLPGHFDAGMTGRITVNARSNR